MDDIRVIVWGLGTIGCLVAKYLDKKKGLTIVGAVDEAEEKVGRDLGDIAALGKVLGVEVSNNPEKVFTAARPDVAIVCTASGVEEVYPQLLVCLQNNANVITSAEDMAEPFVLNPQLATTIDTLAKEHSVTVLGSGIIPGSIDALILFLTTFCVEVDSIRFTRTTCLYPRAKQSPLLRAFGCDVDPSEFAKLASAGVITGHRGGKSSFSLVARALGWKLDEIKETLEPIIVGDKVRGTRKIDIGIVEGREAIVHDASVLAPGEAVKTQASIEINGTPTIKLLFEPYDFSAQATAATMVNEVPHVVNAKAGLITVLDLPITYAMLQDARQLLSQSSR